VEIRRKDFQKYLHDLQGVENIRFLYPDLPEGVCPLYFPILIDNPGYVCKSLYRNSVFTFHWWAGYHRYLPWSDFPDACYLKDHLLTLPVHHQMKDKHIDYIIQKLLTVMQESKHDISR
jgi:dTDP-4-amino-4,6-dideoxygalactose transaminase